MGKKVDATIVVAACYNCWQLLLFPQLNESLVSPLFFVCPVDCAKYAGGFAVDLGHDVFLRVAVVVDATTWATI